MNFKSTIKRGAVATALVLTAAPLVASASFATSPTAPASPAAVALTSGNRSLAVSWTESSTGSITYTATATATGKATKSCSTKTLGCSIHSLINGVVYDVTVVAKNTVGSSAPSADVTSVVGVPSAPNSIHATAGTAKATISWAPPKASGVTHVTSYMATANPGGFSCSTTSSALAKAARTCDISGLTTGTKYTVTVTATNAYGTGAPSKSTTVTPN